MKPSDKILLGIYGLRPLLNDELPLEASQLAWVLKHGASGWVGDNGPKKLEHSDAELSNKPYFERPLKDKSRVRKELSSLAARNYVSFLSPKGFDNTFRIQLLSDGMLRAEKLDSIVGKMDILYSDNKNGIIGVLLIVVVSVITSLLTSWLASNG